MIDSLELSKFTNNLNILFVEDETSLREEICELLNIFFNQVDCTTDGVEALEKYSDYLNEENRAYDIILTDLNMPNMDGIELIKRIKTINPNQIIIVLSASNEHNKIIELINYGIDSFILKPMNHKIFISTLYKTAKNVVNNKKVQEELNTKLLLAEYSKLSTLNWLMNSISCQWKQPLTIIKADSSSIELKIEAEIPLSEQELLFSTKNIGIQVDHLDQLMTELKNIFNVNINKEYIDIYLEIKKIYNLIQNDLSSRNIMFEVISQESIKTAITTIDFKYTIINLIKYSVDKIMRHQTNEGKIQFDIRNSEDNIFITMVDNIGVVNDKNDSTELAINISKILIERNGGKINHYNNNDQSYIEISLPN